MTRILIRCDASLQIGSGHVIRCRTLARELKQRGAEVLFICRRQPGDLVALLEQEFCVLSLHNQPLASSKGLEGRELYEAWLGCSQSQDADDCIKAIASERLQNVDWLVVDHYGIDITWQSQILIGLCGDTPTRLLIIDDLANRPHKADLLLDQNFLGMATDLRYQALVPSHCRQLLGPAYALLGPEYSQLHSLVPERTKVQRILVFFGGVDQDNLTGRTLEALTDPRMAHLSVDVVLGRLSPHRQVVLDLVAQRAFTTLHDPLPSLAGLIARADLAIGAGGSTTWERACLKLPSLVVTIAANQMPFAQALNHAGHLELLGDSVTVTAEQIRSAILAQITGPLQNDAGSNLTDGLGAKRLALAMLGPQTSIILRSANADDEPLLLRWANDPQVRASSFSPDPISPSDHHQWFVKGLTNPNRLLLIATMGDYIPIGQIRFDLQAITQECHIQEAMVDLSIDRCARGHGLAVELVHLGLQAMERHFGPNIEAVAEVLTTNRVSNACFRRAGFSMDEPVSTVAPTAQAVNRWRWRQKTEAVVQSSPCIKK